MRAQPAHTPAAVRVIAVDDHAGFLLAACELLGATPGFVAIGQAASGEDAVELCARVVPDLVLMDVHMPGIGGIEATTRVLDACPRTVVVLISAYAPGDLPAPAWACGASAILPKDRLSPRTLTRLWQIAANDPPGCPLTEIPD